MRILLDVNQISEQDKRAAIAHIEQVLSQLRA